MKRVVPKSLAREAALSDTKLIEEFIRVEARGDRIQVLVCEVSWDSPYEPVSTWTPAKKLPSGSPPEEVAAVVEGLVHDRRYFQVCTECSVRKPAGWMHDEKLCQGCAQRVLGVVY